MAVIHVVERFLASAPSGEKDRRLALYAVRTVTEDLFRGFAPLWVFPDERDDIVALACSSGGPAWLEAISGIESRASATLSGTLVIAHAMVPGAETGISDTYEALSAEIADKSSHRSFVVLAQTYIDSHFGEPHLSLEDVAAAAQISPGYLSRLLKHETGFSFVDYLTRGPHQQGRADHEQPGGQGVRGCGGGRIPEPALFQPRIQTGLRPQSGGVPQGRRGRMIR